MTMHRLRKGAETRSCESRASADGTRFELVVIRDGISHVESFSSLEAMVTRERQLVGAWGAHGWKEDR